MRGGARPPWTAVGVPCLCTWRMNKASKRNMSEVEQPRFATKIRRGYFFGWPMSSWSLDVAHFCLQEAIASLRLTTSTCAMPLAIFVCS